MRIAILRDIISNTHKTIQLYRELVQSFLPFISSPILSLSLSPLLPLSRFSPSPLHSFSPSRSLRLFNLFNCSIVNVPPPGTAPAACVPVAAPRRVVCPNSTDRCYGLRCCSSHPRWSVDPETPSGYRMGRRNKRTGEMGGGVEGGGSCGRGWSSTVNKRM